MSFFSNFIEIPVLLYVLFRLVRLFRNYLKWRRMQVIPGPKCSFWLGQFPAIRAEPFMEPHKRWIKDIVGYDAPLLRYSGMFGTNMMLVLDPEIIREILMAPAGKDDCRFYKPIFFLPPIIGKGLVTLEGVQWLKHRRLIQPAFSVSFLKEALDTSVPPKVTTFIQLWLEAGETTEIDVATHLSALTLDVIGEVAFSHDTNGLQDIQDWVASTKKSVDGDEQVNKTPELSDPLITSFTAFLRPDYLRLFFFLTGFGVVDQYINPKTKRLKTALNQEVTTIIASARKTMDTNSSSTTTKSLIQLLMHAKEAEPTSNGGGSSNNGSNGSKPALSDVELRDELKTFLLAGHETTSTWCYWALYALAKYPDVQEKLYQDVMKEAPSTNTNSKTDSTTISLEQVERMEYLGAFLQECLRLFPPVGMMMRQNRFEETFAGYKITTGTNLIIPVHLLHRHPKYWGPDAETFRPERWMSDSDATAGGLDTKGFTFLPFGAGGHNCIGYRFATLEAKLIMAHLVRALRVEIAPSQRNVEHTFTTIVTMKAKPALRVVVKSRSVSK